MFNNDWDIILKEEIEKDYFKEIINKVNKLYKEKIIYPKKEDIFKALKNTSYKDTKVVIIGQDPYHGSNEAEGLCFSVKDGIKIPPSLRNIFIELKNDLGIEIPKSGSLAKWSKEGVLLLNSILTVEEDKPLSHKKLGWDKFTDNIIRKLNEKDEPIVYMLWGNFAKSKKELITNPKAYIIESNHPSPLAASRGFFNTKPFSKANNYLIKNKIKPVNFDLN